MQGIYTYIPETNYVPREYSVAAILLLLFMVLLSLVSLLNLLFIILLLLLLLLLILPFCSTMPCRLVKIYQNFEGNVGNYLPVTTAEYRRRREFSAAPL